MNEFSSYFLMDTEAAKRYCVEVLGYFSSAEGLDCREIGDGNINYVFRISSPSQGKSIVLKQADRLLRSSGRPLDRNRSRLEAEALSLEAQCCPGLVPELISYDDVMHITAMEDISDYKNLRELLMEGTVYPHLAESLSKFLTSSLMPGTDLVLPADEKKARVKYFINPELCDISEDLVFSEPYMAGPWRERNRNIISPGNEEFMKRELTDNQELLLQAAILRNSFMNNAQTLLHGDLHTGSVFANEKGIKIIDPEFAFYGPAGYDIGNVLGNLFFSLAWAEIRATGSSVELKALIQNTFELSFKKLSEKYDELVSFPLYKNPRFKNVWIAGVMADSLGYAGTEIIRRTVGDSKVKELSSLPLDEDKLRLERKLIRLAQTLILRRAELKTGSEIIRIWEGF